MEEDCCLVDALLPEVIARAQQERQKFRSLACNPEENWLDGYVAGWFAGHFHHIPLSSEQRQQKEILYAVHPENYP